MTFAVVPAAGLSTRMGRPKLSLPIGGRTVLEQVITALRDGGVDCVLVVVAPHVRELVPLAKASGAEVCELPEPTSDMRATVERGLDWLQDRYRPNPTDRWLLAPADHPTLSAEVVRQLLAGGQTDRQILIPVFGLQRGHPTVFSWQHVSELRVFHPGEGINAYLRQKNHDVLEVSVASRAVLFDLDTPEAYAQLSMSPKNDHSCQLEGARGEGVANVVNGVAKSEALE